MRRKKLLLSIISRTVDACRSPRVIRSGTNKCIRIPVNVKTVNMKLLTDLLHGNTQLLSEVIPDTQNSFRIRLKVTIKTAVYFCLY